MADQYMSLLNTSRESFVRATKAPPAITPFDTWVLFNPFQRPWRVPCEHGGFEPPPSCRRKGMMTRNPDFFLMIFPFFISFHFTRKREIRCMDLGMTALGNWKAQQGGCTHIQVRTSIRRNSTRVQRISQRGRIPFPPLL